MAVDEGKYQYDVALSFAGEDRPIVEKLADLLRLKGLEVFYDDFKKSDLWGRDLFQHLDDVYANQARFCVIFVSEAYASKAWTNHELKSAQSRAFLQKNDAYILPVRLDDTKIPGIRPTMGYMDLRPGRDTFQAVANATLEKIAAAKAALAAAGKKKAKPAAAMRSTGSTVKRAVAPAKRKKSAGGVLVDSAGDWILLADGFFQAQSLERPDNKRLVVTVVTSSAAADARLEEIHARRNSGTQQMSFAFANDAYLVRCESATSTYESGIHKWRIGLLKENIQYGGDSMEMAYSDGKNRYSTEQLARMRAERILFGMHSALPAKRGTFDVSGSMVESFIQGSNTPLKVTGSPIQDLAKKMPRDDVARFLGFARLATLFYLKAGGVVERVERLTLGPLKGNSVHVLFRGQRRQKYSNVNAEVIELEGDCPLP